jgi:glycerol kinase
MQSYILALDQGTTSSRAIIFDSESHIISIAQKEFRQIFPDDGWVEHDPLEIWSSQMGVAAEAVTKAGLTADAVAAIGITNQRETTILWERKTGQPVYNAIVWQDRRTATYCDRLIKEGHGPMIKAKTGLIIDAYFSASKINWLMENISGLRQKAEAGEICFGTVDSWLLWNLTRGRVHTTDITNASRTMLFNIHTGQWDKDLLKLFNIPSQILPEVRSCSEIYAYTENILTSVKIPVGGIAGDQQAALFGQMCIHEGMVKNTYGTGCFMLMNTGTKPVESHNQLLTTIAWKIGDKTEYALEGSVFNAGAVVQWLRDGLKLIRSSDEIEKLAMEVEDNGGVYMVPAFTGLGAPYWNPHARGMISGITRGTSSAHFARAALESIAFQTCDVLRAMAADAHIAVRELRVDGGATVNDLLMQFQSDILDCKVIRPAITETTALGAAYLAGLAVGIWPSVEQVQKQWMEDKTFLPGFTQEQRAGYTEAWHNAVQSAIQMTQSTH